MVEIKKVEKNSFADKAGIKEGDMLVSINGNNITDVLDYRFYIAEKKLEIRLCRDKTEINAVIKKGQYDDIGLEFETYLMDKKQTCKNKCVFCFIDQNPKGMRKDVYFKDDDSRLSFFFGNYITLTNLSESDAERIIKMHISPINISVHTTNPTLRVKMMKNKNAGESLKYLKMFNKGNISMNTQIVLCKGLNDKEELEKTITDLSAYYPNMQSIAVVPSGLTMHREGLFPLEAFDKESAAEVIDIIDKKRRENEEKYGERIVQAADEWYILAKKELPDEEYYDGYPQLDNGVGCITSQKSEIKAEIEYQKEIGFKIEKKREVSVVTGVAAYDFIKKSCETLENEFENLKVNVYCAVNHFFGETITVAGLLTGSDMYECLKDKELGEKLFIPSVTLKHGTELFLDNTSMSGLSEKLKIKIEPTLPDGLDFVRKIIGAQN